jgi:hypothetical protein
MSQASFPGKIASLTSEWLTQVLRTNGVLQNSAVTTFTVKPISGGYTSLVYHLELKYDDIVQNAPPSLVVKFHGNSASTRAQFEALGIYEKEVRFYQTLARENTLPVPLCYAAEFDENSGDFVLLLEDLSAARPGSWADDPVGDIRNALTHLAQIHARFWGDPQLEKYDWIVQTTNLVNPPPFKPLWASNLAQARQHYGDQLSEYVWSVCDKWLVHWDEVMLCMSQDTHTLVHTDAHLGQMFFPTVELPRFVLFDWQNPSKSWGAEDVVHPIVAELDVDQRRKHEAALIDHYYDNLCQQGVSDLSRERLWFQCKLSLLWLHFMQINVVVQPDLLQALKADAEEAGDDWRDWVFGQLGPATEDWKLAEVLDQAIDEASSASKPCFRKNDSAPVEISVNR